ncbi:PP2C family serine/threonine-protein phosphatase [Thalassotalea profundi]|uniref:Protein phosphatase n=1 Tax=Thalassotalea profundi TaxID=2036687 RepID=A0ABQ3J2D4_9GAMM|nr:PP2C family serine/threonine-protein phosphatase [Thalassotalea profundi]GHF02047.1 protein phosphatase [Thalassotalea profundi]
MVSIRQLSVSVIGPGHLLNGQPNQDSVLVKRVPSGWLAVVCDGMGSKPHADVGSSQACRSTFDVIKAVDFSIESKALIKRVYQKWLNSLGDIKARDAVTTCLIAWLSDSGELRTFQLGDGLILTSQQTTEKLDTNDFGNFTTGLGKSKQFSDWQVTQQQLTVGDVIALMTDGISEDLHQGMELDFVNSIVESTKGKSIRQAKAWLKNEFRNWGTPNHTDDKTLALLVLS